jgi:hypothetical protein
MYVHTSIFTMYIFRSLVLLLLPCDRGSPRGRTTACVTLKFLYLLLYDIRFQLLRVPSSVVGSSRLACNLSSYLVGQCWSSCILFCQSWHIPIRGAFHERIPIKNLSEWKLLHLLYSFPFRGSRWIFTCDREAPLHGHMQNFSVVHRSGPMRNAIVSKSFPLVKRAPALPWSSAPFMVLLRRRLTHFNTIRKLITKICLAIAQRYKTKCWVSFLVHYI